jgi:hypothetical protein
MAGRSGEHLAAFEEASTVRYDEARRRGILETLHGVCGATASNGTHRLDGITRLHACPSLQSRQPQSIPADLARLPVLQASFSASRETQRVSITVFQ